MPLHDATPLRHAIRHIDMPIMLPRHIDYDEMATSTLMPA